MSKELGLPKVLSVSGMSKGWKTLGMLSMSKELGVLKALEVPIHV